MAHDGFPCVRRWRRSDEVGDGNGGGEGEDVWRRAGRGEWGVRGVEVEGSWVRAVVVQWGRGVSAKVV